VLRLNDRIKCVDSCYQFIKSFKKYDYATLKEEKLVEYRILLLYGEPFRIMAKFPIKKTFAYKQEYCQFVDIDIDDFKELYSNKIFVQLKKMVWKININLCGVDLILNQKGELKVLEVNSGAGMCGKSIKTFYKKLIKMLFENETFIKS